MKLIIGFTVIVLLVLSAKLIAGSSVKHQVGDKKLTAVGQQMLKINSRIDGLKLALYQAKFTGADIKGTILLLHGSSFPSQLSFAFKMAGKSWVDQLTAAGFRVYCLDFLGYGDSDRYPEMLQSIATAKPLGRGTEVVNDVKLAVDFILKKHGLTKIDVLGHSWGGAVAASFAELYPEKVNHLVLYAAITKRETPQYNSEQSIPAFSELTPEQRILSLAGLSPDAEQPLLAQEMFKHWGEAWLKSDPLALISGKVRYPAGPNADVMDFFNGDSFYNPANIRAKVLVVRGEHDQYPSNQQAYQLFKALNNAESKRYTVINNGTHVLHLEQNRAQLYQTVSQFLLVQD